MTLPRRSPADSGPLDPSSPLTTAERNALIVNTLLPDATVERTRDAFQFGVGGDAGIVVFVTAEAVELRLPTVEWASGAYDPVETSRLWKRLTWSKLQDGQLAELINTARRGLQRALEASQFGAQAC